MFYTDFPKENAPLTRPHRTDPRLAEKWDLVIFGAEQGTAYSELVDPLDQRERLVSQSLLAAAGDAEAMQVDEDFLEALEYGMPPDRRHGPGRRPAGHEPDRAQHPRHDPVPAGEAEPMTSDVSADVSRRTAGPHRRSASSPWPAMVVGSMVGGGVFTLPSSFGSATGVLGAVIAWTIAGIGMLMLAFVFQSLALRRPDLDNGIYVYAQAGFGNYAGFNAAWGYWASNVVGNVFFMVFAMATIGEFVPGLGDGNTVLAVAARLGRRLGLPRPDRARRPAGRRHQPDRHRRQAAADPGLHRARR